VALKTIKKAGEYKIAFSGDDALNFTGSKKEIGKALVIAWETGVYPVKPGQSPVFFVMKPLGSDAIGRWYIWRDEHGNRIAGTAYGNMVLARMALVRIEGSEDMSVTPIEHKTFGVIASAETSFDLLGPELSKSVQFELGEAVYHRETVTLGKS
jgi:hypothetical protein